VLVGLFLQILRELTAAILFFQLLRLLAVVVVAQRMLRDQMAGQVVAVVATSPLLEQLTLVVLHLLRDKETLAV